jgi:mannose/cellobiose epimerase-like protein (N-acyl-D-glucosamine 2-epimerase family)
MKFLPRYNFYSAVFNLAIIFSSFAAYELKCPSLINPELNIPYIDSCAKFWIKAYDNASGGFFSDVGQTGNVMGGTKFTQIQARDIYAMTHAFMVTGNEEYLEYARKALDWMYAHCWDNTNGGWYVEMDAAGNPASMSWGKTYFWEFYSLMGVVTTYEVTRRATDKIWLDKSWDTFNSHMWDTRAGVEGYFNMAGNDWSNPSLKGFGPSGDALNTHAVNIYLATDEERHLTRLEQLGDNIVDHLISDMDNCVLGFREIFGNNWEPMDDYNLWVGHLIKTAWCLARVHLIVPKQEYADGVAKIIDNAWNNGGWDHSVGAPNHYANYATGEVSDRNRDCWNMEQAVNAGLIAWYVTGSDTALKMADQAMDFYMKHVVDHVNGEAYNLVGPTGEVMDAQKGTLYKGGYHSTELGFLAYWYASLYYHKKPVKIYYRFYPESSNREIRLWPEAIEDDKLVISKVLKDGKAFESFDMKSRTISLDAQEEGVFEVTFDLAENTSVRHPHQILKTDARNMTASITNGRLLLNGLNPSDAGNVTICRLNGAKVLTNQLPMAEYFSVSVPELNAGLYIVSIRESKSAVNFRLWVDK